MYYTPRRLALLMRSVADRQADQVLERKGPAIKAAFDSDNQPTAAAMGFARSVGKQVGELETLRTDKGEWLFCRVEQTGQHLRDLLYPMLEQTLARLPIHRPMRWAAHDFSFIRPVHWLLVLHGSEVVAGGLLGLKAGNTSQGHRIHSPKPIVIESAHDYVQRLENAYVIVDPQKRQAMIEQQLLDLSQSCGARALIDPALLQEVTNLVEWPRAIACRFDLEFLEVPAEALIASMQDHQKFFPMIDSESGELIAQFIAVANLESQDVNAVRQGFERVIRPRLADARFFWDQDSKSSIERWLPRLDDIVYQNKLGSVGDKSRRIASISKMIASECALETDLVQRAALLCKCDLVSQMVSEFPELQGIMGRYYALNSGEAEGVANAIGDHYLPAYSGDRIPDGLMGKVIALSDRLDTLMGIFASGLKPTGNKDPFALRRAALGLIRILLEGEPAIDLDHVLAIAANVLQEQIAVPPAIILQLRLFIIERLKQHLRESGYETGLVNAALDAPLGSLPDLKARLDALRYFMTLEDAGKLVAANKRISNILRKSDLSITGKIVEDKLIIEEERRVFDDVHDISIKLDDLHQAADYRSSLALLVGLSNGIEAFFEQVMVMDEDPGLRMNRLNLLATLKGLFDRIGNLARIG